MLSKLSLLCEPGRGCSVIGHVVRGQEFLFSLILTDSSGQIIVCLGIKQKGVVLLDCVNNLMDTSNYSPELATDL